MQLEGLPRNWPSVELPGHREHREKFSTYTAFSYDELPPIERELDDDLNWLLAEKATETSLVGLAPEPGRPATDENLKALMGDLTVNLPPAFTNFIASPEPRHRVRSPTDCHLDLGEAVVPVTTGGVLIHFLSDSQSVLHWLLYAREDGSEAVVATRLPYGFVHPEVWYEDVKPRRTFVPNVSAEAVVCASTFSEFLYRFWIENEIWFALKWDHRPLTREQRRYIEHYPQRAAQSAEDGEAIR